MFNEIWSKNFSATRATSATLRARRPTTSSTTSTRSTFPETASSLRMSGKAEWRLFNRKKLIMLNLILVTTILPTCSCRQLVPVLGSNPSNSTQLYFRFGSRFFVEREIGDPRKIWLWRRDWIGRGWLRKVRVFLFRSRNQHLSSMTFDSRLAVRLLSDWRANPATTCLRSLRRRSTARCTSAPTATSSSPTSENWSCTERWSTS